MAMPQKLRDLKARAEKPQMNIAKMVKKAKDDERELSESELTSISVWDEEVARLGTDIAKEEGRLEAEAANRPVIDVSDGPDRFDGLGNLIPAGNDNARPVGKRGGPTFVEMFGAPRASGFATLESFLAPIHASQYHPSLQPMAAMGEGSGSAGGYSVPEEFAAAWLDASLENEIVRPRATIEPMISETKKVAGIDASDNSAGALFGGISGQWLGEGDEADNEDMTFRQIKLTARKLAVFSIASNELISDGTGLEAQVEGKITQAVGWHLDYAFLRGTGAGQPLGVLNDPALVVVPKETGQVADTIIYTNLIKMLARLHAASFAKSVWVCNPTCIPSLLQLTINVGTSGSHIPVMTESDGGFQMLTRPVLFTEKLPVLGTEGDILLADLSQYVIGLRREVSLEKSMHVRWQTDESAWRCIVRADGQGSWNQEFTPRNGDSQSWCVALAER